MIGVVLSVMLRSPEIVGDATATSTTLVFPQLKTTRLQAVKISYLLRTPTGFARYLMGSGEHGIAVKDTLPRHIYDGFLRKAPGKARSRHLFHFL